MPTEVTQRYDVSYTIKDGGAGREEIWKNVLYNYKNSPEFNKIFGWGAGTISYFNNRGMVAHNIWIESLMEIGIIGVIVLLIFYFTYLKKAYTMGEYMIVASYIGYMIMTISMSLYSYKPIWNIIILIIILKNNRYEVGNNISKVIQNEG